MQPHPRTHYILVTTNQAMPNTDQMADKQKIKHLQERVDRLEELVNSLAAKNASAASTEATKPTTSTANSMQSVSAAADEKPVPYLMELPPELRTDILGRVLLQVFAADPYGLTPPLSLPVTMYTSRTRLPAILHVNQVMRTESIRLYLNIAQTKIADLEIENKRLYQAHENLKNHLERTSGVWGRGGALDANLQAMSNSIIYNFTAMTDVDAACKALQGTFEHKKALPPRWIIRAR